MKNTAYIRYTVGIVALLLGFAISIQRSDRGLLFNSQVPDALASSPATPDDYDLHALPILNRVLLQMGDNYVEPDRIDPARMLVHALDRVQNSVPEVVALFDRDMEDQPTQVEIRVSAQRETFAFGEIESLWAMSFKLREIFRFVETHLDSTQTDLREVEYAAINGMLSTLDPHSVLLSPRVYADMQTSNRGEFGGLGIVISIRDGQITVISPIPDTPASRAGFRSGDRIVKIDDESTVNMALDEAVSRLRGPVGAPVRVEIMRQGWTEPHQFTLERDNIQIVSVNHHALDNGIGYLQITNFQQNTHSAMLEALEALESDLGQINGLIIDLRNNPGGLLQAAIRISDTFLTEGSIVTTVGVGDRLREVEFANATGTQPNYPIVVLVNPGSASASEIVAGALKNNNRAIVVGDRTFGKGSVQVLYPHSTDGSALKLTIAQYLTPGDLSIQGVGIVPDIIVFPASVTDDAIDLYAGETFMREGDLETSLSSERVSASEELPSAIVKYFHEPEEHDPDAINDPSEFQMDFEIAFARDLLLGAGDTYERTTMLGRIGPVIERHRTEQLAAIQERLRVRNIDWSQGENVIQPVSLVATTNRSGHQVTAGDPIELTLTATNNGQRPLFQVRAVSQSSYPLFDDREFVFGRLDPGESRSWTVTMEVPREDTHRVDRVSFRTFADTINLNAEASLLVHVVGGERPHWGMSYWIDDAEGGNGDGRVQVGETVRFHLAITNTGAGDAGETTLILRNRSDRAVFLIHGRETADRVDVGSTHRATFEFTLQELPEDGVLRLDAEVYDSDFREYLREELTLEVADPVDDVTAESGYVHVNSGTEIRIGATADSPVVALNETETVLATNRRTTDFVQVSWETGAGWVLASATRPASEQVDAQRLPTDRILYQPPNIVISSTEREVRDSSYTIRGTITDDSQVRDYYIIVNNQVSPRRSQSVKRAYEYVGERETTFEQVLPLRPGSNRITVVARDDDQAVSSRVHYVYLHE